MARAAVAVRCFSRFLPGAGARAQGAPASDAADAAPADPPEPLVIVQALRPAGLRIAVQDRPGTELVLFQANVNLPIDEGTQRGQLSGNVLEPADGFWTLHLPEPVIKVGDVIFYWIHVRVNKHGYTYPTKIAKITARQDESCLPSITTFNGKTACKGQLIAEENFNSLESSTWEHTIQFPNIHNPYFSIYTASLENSFAENGILHLRPSQVPDDIVNGALTLEGCTGQRDTRDCSRRAAAWDVLPAVYSAWLRSRDAFRFGRVERADAALEEGVQETARVSLAFLRGNANLTWDNGTAIGASRLSPGVVLGYCYRKLALGMECDVEGDGLWTDDFHVFGVTWSPEEIVFGMDGHEIYTLRPPDEGFTLLPFFEDCPRHARGKIAPLDQEMYLNIALHVGGSHEFPSGVTSRGLPKPWNDKDPKANLNFWKEKNQWLPTWSLQKSEMKIDWIRIWAL
ncbi:Beta-1,3-glucan-binding protein [Gryllus bimaculatus]|nr:Beta-1,3-glucan-binding protein [Gryllus bimaculatus]